MSTTIAFSGDTLRRLREGQGHTQRKMDHLTGICQTTISDYERGIHVPTLEYAIRLAVALGVTVDDLLEPVGDRSTA